MNLDRPAPRFQPSAPPARLLAMQLEMAQSRNRLMLGGGVLLGIVIGFGLQYAV